MAAAEESEGLSVVKSFSVGGEKLQHDARSSGSG
ncbi:hypothetical protein OROHE_013080 [Orobanche hederae]